LETDTFNMLTKAIGIWSAVC